MAEKHVQTTLPRALHEALCRLAKKKGKPLNAVVREAIKSYLEEGIPIADDPVSRFVGRGRPKGGDWPQRKDGRD